MSSATVKAPAKAKTKTPKESKSKKVAAAPRKPRAYPSYHEMVSEAIAALKERTGSSQIAIAKFIEDKQKSNLPTNFKKLLLVQLKKLVANGKLVKVKNSFKLPPKSAAPSNTVGAAKKPTLAKAPVDAKGKTKSKPKGAPGKRRAVVEPKSKKVAKTAIAKSPGKKVVAVEKKKTTAKGVKKPKSIKSPVKNKKASAKKTKK